MAIKLKVVQVRSCIGRPQTQRKIMAGLGLGRMNRQRVLEDTPAIRGMLRKVQHLIRVEPVQ